MKTPYFNTKNNGKILDQTCKWTLSFKPLICHTLHMYMHVYTYTKNILYILKITRADCSIRNSLVYIFNFTNEDTLTKGSQGSYTEETHIYIYTEVAQLRQDWDAGSGVLLAFSPLLACLPHVSCELSFPEGNRDSQHSNFSLVNQDASLSQHPYTNEEMVF